MIVLEEGECPISRGLCGFIGGCIWSSSENSNRTLVEGLTNWHFFHKHFGSDTCLLLANCLMFGLLI